MQNKRSILRIFGGIVILAGVGCDEDGIRKYQVPHVDPPSPRRPAAMQQADRPQQRMLTAIFPTDQWMWFFKLIGSPQGVQEHSGEFLDFIESVRFTGKEDPAIDWKVPQGWQEMGASGFRYRTFRIGPPEAGLDLSVTKLPREGEAGSILANVNRWRGQLGLRDVSAELLAQTTRQTEVGGVKVTLVDITSPGKPVAETPVAPPAGAKGPLTWTAPDDWKKAPAAPPRLVTFQASDGEKTAEVTIMAFPGDVGGLVANVNRWRGQAGLEPAGDDQVRKEARSLEVAGKPADYVDIVGPKLRILGVSVPHGGQTYFINMKGPADVVGKHQAAFEAFARSVKFSE